METKTTEKMSDYPGQHPRGPEYILCAAIHFDDGKQYIHQPVNITSGFVVAGRRHHNCYITYAAIRSQVAHDGALYEAQLDPMLKNRPENTQGFLTSHDRFIDRYEAA